MHFYTQSEIERSIIENLPNKALRGIKNSASGFLIQRGWQSFLFCMMKDHIITNFPNGAYRPRKSTNIGQDFINASPVIKR